MKIGRKIKELRIKANMTQSELANKLNFARQSVSKWEQGINEPNLETIRELSKIFGVSVSEFIGDDNEPHQATKEEKYLKATYVLLLISAAVCFFMIFSSFVIMKIMNDQVPMHFDSMGNITRYGSKYERLIFVGIVLFFFGGNILNYLFYRKKVKFDFSPIITSSFLLICIIGFGVAFLVGGFKYAKDLNSDLIPTLVNLSIVVIMTASFFSLPIFNNKINYIIGFRTKFTMSNKEVWHKLNCFQGITGIFFSLIAFVLSLIIFNHSSVYLFSLIFIDFVASFAYHEILRKKHSRLN